MNVRLRSLDVIVEVISEGLDVRNNLGHALGCQVAGEKNWKLLVMSKLHAILAYIPKVT